LRGKLAVPVIGFSGAPFTLASYLIAGKPSRTGHKTKRFMLEHPDAWDELMRALSAATVEYLRAQIAAGAQAVQLFDSWIGCLSVPQYRAQVLPHVQGIFAALKSEGVPRIHFATNTAHMLEDFANVDCEVVGVDWRVELRDAKARVGTKSLQGNLDPAMLLAPWDTLARTVDGMFGQIDPKQGYIFNLGHGMPPEADNAVVKKLVDYVHAK
jgi:uroporphyrinogen decarboxylase